MLNELRKIQALPGSQIDDPRIDRDKRRIGRMRISRTQWRIFEILWAHKSQIVEKSTLIDLLWGTATIKNAENVLYVLISRLRHSLSHLAEDPVLPRYEIVNARGRGYLLRARRGEVLGPGSGSAPDRRARGLR